MTQALCPHCNAALLTLKIVGLDGISNNGSYHCVAYVCPSCNRAISAQIDPVEIEDRLINAIRNRD